MIFLAIKFICTAFYNHFPSTHNFSSILPHCTVILNRVETTKGEGHSDTYKLAEFSKIKKTLPNGMECHAMQVNSPQYDIPSPR